jgi:hypothetical protein
MTYVTEGEEGYDAETRRAPFCDVRRLRYAPGKPFTFSWAIASFAIGIP